LSEFIFHTQNFKMKTFSSILLAIYLLSSCGNSKEDKTVSDAKALQSGIEAMKPGTIPTKNGEWTMTAKVNGKDWQATSMMSPEAAGRIIGYYKEESISLPYDRREMVVGYKNTFGENNAVDLFTSDDVGLWGGRKGEMIITKVDGDWAEGTFFVTGTSSDTNKTLEVTDGFFRISLAGK
jgi:hypothetical protein